MSLDLDEGVGYRIDASGRGVAFDWSVGAPPVAPGELCWIHLDIRSDTARSWLVERSGLEAIVIDALLEDATRPRCVEAGDGLIVVLRGVNLNPGADPEDMVALRIWVEDGLVVSTRRRPLIAVRELRADVEAGRGPHSSGDFLVDVAYRLVERMSGVLSALDEAVDAVEEMLVDPSAGMRRGELTAIRRQAIALRRYLAPQRDALARLHNERVPWLSERQRLQMREVADTTIRYVEDLEAARERTALTQEEINGRLSEQLNRRMYALSIVAGVFLPLSFITGLLGINVAGVPGAENPTAFALVCGALLALGVAELLLFRRVGWL